MSSEPWNEFNLPQPPIVTILVRNSRLDLSSFRKTIDKAIVCYESQKDLDESAAICSRLLARRQNSFRNFKGFRDLRKANSALCRLLRLDIVMVLKTFAGNLPEFIKTDGLKTELPSQECFDYLLLRLIALQKLYMRITACCIDSASYFIKIINKNFFFDILAVFLATIARIWNICRDNAQLTAELYTNLLKYRKDFPLRRQTLCEDFEFPTTLEYGRDSSSSPVTDQLKNYVEMSKTLAKDSSDDEVKIVPSISFKQDVISNLEFREQTIPKASSSMVDVGVAISRENSNNSSTSLQDLKTLESILSFIRDEDKKRSKSLSDCLTKNVSDNTWKKWKKKVSKVPKNDNRSAVKLMRNLLGNLQ